MTRTKTKTILIIAVAVLLIAAGVIAALFFFGGEEKFYYEKTYTYEEAMEIYDGGNKVEGLAALRTVKGKKAQEKRKEIYLSMFSEDFYNEVQNAKVGDRITFGRVDQDDNYDNGKEDIVWRVLDKDSEGRLLLISEEGIESVQYHKKYEDITWENSFIRQWLNETFIKELFTEEEQSIIPTVLVKNDDNEYYGTDAGNDTYDKLFLLSIDEAEKYFENDRDRMTSATDTAGIHYAYEDPFGNTAWWLRSPSFKQNYACIVADTGSIYDGAFHKVSELGFSVRPAFWLDLS